MPEQIEILQLNNASETKCAMQAIKVDPAGIALMQDKALFLTIKIKDLKPIQANIIKQEMLSLGGEAATSYGVLNHTAKKSDVLLFGTLKQFKLLIKKFKTHQFKLPELGRQLSLAINNYYFSPKDILGLKFGRRTYIMGVLNVTPDSFSDGGLFYDHSTAIEHALKMIKQGADIIDIGGESTRPGAKPVSAKEEIKRTLPVIKKLAKKTKAIISIDTQKSAVARAAIAAGASMVNDVSGLRYDKKMAKIVARSGAALCIMHMQGNPRSMQKKPHYKNLMADIIKYLDQSIEIAKNAGILLDKIIVDPGIGFGKTVDHNLEILRNLKTLKVLGRPVLIGTSRKSLIGKVLGLPVEQRSEGTAATVSVAISNGADIIRVHDVAEMKKVAKMTDTIVRKG